jgi:hypothetical protein
MLRIWLKPRFSDRTVYVLQGPLNARTFHVEGAFSLVLSVAPP